MKQLIQDILVLSSFGRRFTSMDYEYDLISGNVNRVWYQKGKLEQFSHRYRYDADNRVTHVYTTNIFKVKRDSVVSQERLEARYFYLPTGALSRAELGHKQIQGIDYAYTLQGWLKDINGYRSSGTDMYDSYDSYDIGNDGVIQTDNVNRLFAHDGYASSIQYYQGDYTPVSGNNYFNELSYDAIPLYNGNISALSESVYNLGEKGFLKLFRYDKLNRIKRMRTAAHHYDNPGWESVSDNFATDYAYDWNGNLLFLHRKKQSGQEMHNIRYTYPNDNNRLGAITSTGIASSAYQYDALGNLTRDNAEGLTVSWNAMGKVDTIRRNGNLLSMFRYRPTGRRQVEADSSGTTCDIHDATGKVMCVYKLHGDTLTATERYLYGSKRLGMLEQQIWITANSIGLQDSNTIGVRVYEFTDYLGNVTYTAQDRKWLVQDSYGQLQYLPFTVTYTDYYPFGYPMPGRSFTMGGYRYFFNGQEADNEVLGEGASLTAEFWQYDTRLGRRWNVDPVFKEYESPYACFAGNPVWFADPTGDSSVVDAKGYIIYYDENDKDLRVFINENGKLRQIGELGKTIEADTWFANLLKENASVAKHSWSPFGFRNKVKQYGEWDYKYASPDNPNSNIRYHLIGIAFHRKDRVKGSGDLPETHFSFKGMVGRAEDLNNFHFGVVGKAFGLFPENFMLKQAGKVEMEKWAEDGLTVPAEWAPRMEVVKYRGGMIPTSYTTTKLLPPYGDNPVDHEWIKRGFDYYNKNNKSLIKD